nr:MAG TPA: hypothetical protein [Caudoviricetes sp.]
MHSRDIPCHDCAVLRLTCHYDFARFTRAANPLRHMGLAALCVRCNARFPHDFTCHR